LFTSLVEFLASLEPLLLGLDTASFIKQPRMRSNINKRPRFKNVNQRMVTNWRIKNTLIENGIL
jgi:hypothetical protein